MRRLMALSAVSAMLAASVVTTAMAASAPAPTSTVKVSVSNGSLHYDQKTLTAKAGLVAIQFTNNSTTPHHVSLEPWVSSSMAPA